MGISPVISVAKTVMYEKPAVIDVIRIAFVDWQKEILSLSNISDFLPFAKDHRWTSREPKVGIRDLLKPPVKIPKTSAAKERFPLGLLSITYPECGI